MLASDVKIALTKTIEQDKDIIQIRRINIYQSPILTVNHKEKIAHIVLDTGATASLISLQKAKELNLKIEPTVHSAIQVDGVSGLKVMGEIHTQFHRGKTVLQFSGLVVNRLGTDILGGTNFQRENDVYSRMSKNIIVIQGNNVFQTTPVEIMQMDKERKPYLVKVKRSEIIVNGDTIEVDLPPTLADQEKYVVEPRHDQGVDICLPQIVQAKGHKLEIEIKGKNRYEPVKLKKN